MRWFTAWMLFMWPALGLTAGVETASVKRKPGCEQHTPGFEKLDIKCPLTGSGSAQRFRFKANFSGSHDDTIARMKATLNGAPLACEEGSKMELQGEDGDVSLVCKFLLTSMPGTTHILNVRLKWFHAQYTGFELRAD